MAFVFNIQKFSIHDGPGIRSTVFFKGCPLTCFWCSNPESIRPSIQILWNKAKCVLCHHCVNACPASAIEAIPGGIIINHGRCTGCGQCVRVCRTAALTESGKEYSIEEIVSVCLADKDFYAESGGGVTLSGGEVLMQGDFAAELIDRLHSHDIHVTLETNGFASNDVFVKVAAKADMLLLDLKHYDEAKHIAGTGVSNKLIITNIQSALTMNKAMLNRIPVVPGFNDSLDDAKGFAHLMTSLGVDKVELLPFHQLGQNKYDMLGLAYRLDGIRQMHKEDLREYRDTMLAEGLKEVLV